MVRVAESGLVTLRYRPPPAQLRSDRKGNTKMIIPIDKRTGKPRKGKWGGDNGRYWIPETPEPFIPTPQSNDTFPPIFRLGHREEMTYIGHTEKSNPCLGMEEREMDMSIIRKMENGEVVEIARAKTEREATKVARREARGGIGQVYVMWYRESDGQHGYLNIDGHSPIGQAW